MAAVQPGTMQIVPKEDDRPLVDKLLTGQSIRWDRDNMEHRNVLVTLMDVVYPDTFSAMCNDVTMELMDFPHFCGTRTDAPVTYGAGWNIAEVYMMELRHVLNCDGRPGRIVPYPHPLRDIQVGLCYKCGQFLEWVHGPEELWNRMIRSMMTHLLPPTVAMPSFMTTAPFGEPYLIMTSRLPTIDLQL